MLGWYTGSNNKETYTKDLPTAALPWASVLLPTDKAQTKNVGTNVELRFRCMGARIFLRW